MPMVIGPSGSSSPLPGAKEQMTAAMSQQHYQQQARDPRHLLPSDYDLARQSPHSNSNHGRAWAADQQQAPSASSSTSSPRYGNSDRSTSNLRGESSSTSAFSPTSSSSTAPPSMPTTAASLMREGPRDFTVIKDVGDGSFGTVCLADWKSPLPSGTLLSPMQHPTTRPEYLGKRLVAIKKMKKPLPSWEECMKLKELKCLLAIPHHPNIIPLYDAFLMPVSKELHFVFECMEGNLYQLTKSRKGRPLAGGLVASIYQQIVKGLHHIHQQGYFHRDMKPENLLITTTGLADYPSSASVPAVGAPAEKDVLVIVKLADFGLARETDSKPPYTEYVSTRWYRAPEVLLRSRDYSNPVDMWALGTILAELVNLKPLFPGQSEVDQVLQICEVLGDPARDYGRDDRGRQVGGGEWGRGIRMAQKVGFTFPSVSVGGGVEGTAAEPGRLTRGVRFGPPSLSQARPVTFSSLFSSKVPVSLVECIQDLLRYDPGARLTTQDCLEHVYYQKVAPRLQPPQARAVVSATTPEQQAMHVRAVPKAAQMSSMASVLDSAEQRSAMPPSHSSVPQSSKPSFGASSSSSLRQVQSQDADVAMEAASPRPHGNGAAPSAETQWALTPGGPTRTSTISQYPAFPDSASTFAGSHASMHFDEYSMPPHAEGESSEAQFSSSTARDPRHHAHEDAMPHQQGMMSRSRELLDDEMEMMQSQDQGGYSRQALLQQQHSNYAIRNYDHANPMYRHGRPLQQGGMPQAMPDSRTSSDLEGQALAHAQQSHEMVAAKERDGRKGKGWISSVLGGASGSGASANPVQQARQQQQQYQQQQHQQQQQQSVLGSGGFYGHGEPQYASTPAQQLAAEHTERYSAHPADVVPVANSPAAPVDAKKAKKMAEKAAREAEKAKRLTQEKAARERARAVMQKRNQILASSNSKDQVEWLKLADNDMTKALQAPASTPAPSLFQSETSRGKQPSMSQSTGSELSMPHYASNSLNSPYSAYGGQASNSLSSPAWQGSRSSSRGKMRRREYEEEGGLGMGYMASGHYSMDDPRRQSMQSFQTGDSDPGPNRSYMPGSGLQTMHRHGSNSSLNSAPGLIDGSSSARTRMGDRNSFDTRSVASSLDHQLIQNMENMTAAEHRHRTGSTSPGPVHMVGQRPSYSRQSHGSRTSSAHRQGSASPLHHQVAPRFHPYSVGPGGVAANSNGNIPSLPTSAQSSYSFNLPSLASIAQGNATSDYVESLQSSSGTGTIGTRPRSLPRRSSQSIHRGPASRGSVTSGEGVLSRQHGSSGINPMFHVPGGGGLPKSSQQQQQQQQPPSLPPFSHLAAAAASTKQGQEQHYPGQEAGGRNRSHSASYR